ncbi:M48 family metalloprotease, partial [Butyricicoccus faecihominis]
SFGVRFFTGILLPSTVISLFYTFAEVYTKFGMASNIFISGCLLLIKISYWIFSAIMGLFAICSRSGVMGIITAVFAGISTALSWLWVKFCMLFLMWSMRQNEYLADEFAYKIGFGLELATVLDQHISDVPHDGFLSAIYSTHPCNDDRVAALQNLGVPYSRY